MLANLLTRMFVEAKEQRPQLLPLKVKLLIYHPTVQHTSSML